MTNRISDIVFIDRPCGSGKTHEMLDQLKEATGQSYLIVLPTLDEADRYTDALGDQVEVPVPEDTKSLTQKFSCNSNTLPGVWS